MKLWAMSCRATQDRRVMMESSDKMWSTGEGNGKRLMEDSWWENWLRDKLGLVLMSGAMLSKSSIQFSVEGWGCVPSLLFDLRPNYGGGNEDNGDLLQKVPCLQSSTQCPQPCSRPPPTPSSTRDSYPLTGKSGTVSYGVTAPFSWVLVSTRFCLCPPQTWLSNWNDWLTDWLI